MWIFDLMGFITLIFAISFVAFLVIYGLFYGDDEIDYNDEDDDLVGNDYRDCM